MGFTLLPAVDVSGGQSVRLTQGASEGASLHGDPLEAARMWQTGGAEWIHLVDLDAAFKRGSNAKLLADVIGNLDVNVELSGGIDDAGSLDRALSSGCERAILSTAAADDLGWCMEALSAHGERIAVALDVRVVQRNGLVQHQLAARGRDSAAGEHPVRDLWETLAHLDAAGCRRYVVTDVSRDGMLSGPNTQLYDAVTGTTSASVIASGGVSTIEDLVMLASTAQRRTNLEGVIVGKALYEHRFTLREALDAVTDADTATG